jgi:hypothetical protein
MRCETERVIASLQKQRALDGLECRQQFSWTRGHEWRLLFRLNLVGTGTCQRRVWQVAGYCERRNMEQANEGKEVLDSCSSSGTDGERRVRWCRRCHADTGTRADAA